MTIFGGLTHFWNCETDLQPDIVGNVNFDDVYLAGTAPVSVDNPPVNKINQYLDITGAALRTTAPSLHEFVPSGVHAIGFTVALWARFPVISPNGRAEMLVQGGGTGASIFGNLALYYNFTSQFFFFRIEETGGTGRQINFPAASPAVADQWYFVMAWGDVAQGTINMTIDNDEANLQSVQWNGTINAPPSGVSYLGGGGSGAGGVRPVFLDEVAVWDRPLPCHERKALYDSGAGRNLEWWRSITNYWRFESVAPAPERDVLDDISFETAWERIGAPAAVPGKVGSAWNIPDDANHGRMLFKANSLIPSQSLPTGEFTIAFWFRLTAAPVGAHVLLHAGNGLDEPNELAWLIVAENNRVDFLFVQPDNTVITVPGPVTVLSAGTWYHAVVSSTDGGTISVTVDGVRNTVAVGANEIRNVNGPVFLGKAVGTNGVSLRGEIDELSIWERDQPLSVTEEMRALGVGVDLFEGWPVPVPPVTVDDTFICLSPLVTDHDITPVVTLGDCPIDFTTIDFNPVAVGIQSTLVIAGEGTWSNEGGGLVRFTPEVGFLGNSSAPYAVSDTDGDVSNASTLTCMVVVSPSTSNAAFTTPFNTLGSIDLSIANIVVGTNPIDYATFDMDVAPGDQGVVVEPGIGTWTHVGSGVVQFQPVPGFIGVAQVPFLVDDTAGNPSNASTLTVTVMAPPGGGGMGPYVVGRRRRRRS